MINKLIDKYKEKIEYYSKLDSVNCNIRVELYTQILQDLKEVKESTICGHTVEEIITILNGLELERKLDIKMTMENLQILSKKLQEDFQKTLDNSMKNMIDNCRGN